MLLELRSKTRTRLLAESEIKRRCPTVSMAMPGVVPVLMPHGEGPLLAPPCVNEMDIGLGGQVGFWNWPMTLTAFSPSEIAAVSKTRIRLLPVSFAYSSWLAAS